MEALSWDLWNSMQLEVKSQKDYTCYSWDGRCNVDGKHPISAHHKEEIQRVSQEPEKERKKKSWSYSLHFTFYETMTVSWVDFCTWHIVLKPFTNHRKTCLLCGLVKVWILATLCIALVLSVWEWVCPHQCSSKCPSPGRESKNCFCSQSSRGIHGRDERVKAVSDVQEVQ